MACPYCVYSLPLKSDLVIPTFSDASSNWFLNLLRPRMTGTSEPPTYMFLFSVTFGSFLWSRWVIPQSLRLTRPGLDIHLFHLHNLKIRSEERRVGNVFFSSYM